MHGAQGEGCAPVASAYAVGADTVVPVRPTGIAKSLAIGNPADGVYALGVARRTGGSIESVTDAEIVAGIRLLARTTGHLHRDRRRRHHGRAARPGRAGRDRRGRDRGGVHHRRRPEDDRRGGEAAVETIAIPADPDAVDAALGAPAAR